MTPPETHTLLLRDVTEEDLPILFEFHRDPEANYMAAFTSPDPTNREAFETRWAKTLVDDTVDKQVIVVDGLVAGSIMGFDLFGVRTVGYSLGKAYWGWGYATQALALFLKQITTRPLYGRVVKDNFASRRVLEKCGFLVTGEERNFANSRGQEVDELVLRLD
jgi:RimJ/RimL family protein N-acetyltransferase